MIKDAFDPIEERRRYEEETEREAARVKEIDEQSRYLFGAQFERYFPMYVVSHGAEHALGLIGMKDIIAYVKARSAEIVEKIESEARQTIDELRSEARRLREKNSCDATERSINEYLSKDYRRALDRLHEKASSPDLSISDTDWRKLINEQYASLKRKRKDTCRRICLERTRAEAEEREFYLEDYYPSRWI